MSNSFSALRKLSFNARTAVRAVFFLFVVAGLLVIAVSAVMYYRYSDIETRAALTVLAAPKLLSGQEIRQAQELLARRSEIFSRNPVEPPFLRNLERR